MHYCTFKIDDSIDIDILLCYTFMLIGLSLLFLCIIIISRKSKEAKKLLKSEAKKLNRGGGIQAERDLISKLLKSGISESAIFYDLYVKKCNGNFSQIDLVVPTKVGIIVFEVKDYSGWIFGNGKQTQWTQILAYGKEKYRFYNPIMQNNTHIAGLKKQIKNEKVPFYSVIVFYGDCELKDIKFVPERTFITRSTRVIEVVNAIMDNNEPAIYTYKRKVIRVLEESAQNGRIQKTKEQHVENIKDMLGENRIFK